MKKLRFCACLLVMALIMSTSVFAHGQMVTVYKNTGDKIIYEVIAQEKLSSYEAGGWSQYLGYYDSTTHTPMYSDDKRVEIIPNEYVEAQKAVWWYTSPRKTMYSLDNRAINVNIEDIGAYENVYWFIEKAALMTKNGKSQYVIESEIPSYRQDGWIVNDYAGLYGLNK